MNDDKNELIKSYFSMGLQQKEILYFLKNIHGVSISKRTLKRYLSKYNLHRRKNFSKLDDVVQYLEQQLNSSGRMHGYRWMHLKCIQEGFVVTQEIVRELLQILDPSGVTLRRRKRLRRRQYFSKGPNFIWHMDSYDKLKPYGICINGCIDGFSRHIIWLKAGLTSSKPTVIGGYYLRAIKSLGGCPVTVRADMGTENGVVEKMQKVIRDISDTSNTSRPAFMYGKSSGNQRIESWWSILRKQKAQYWINLFETLRDDGLFNGSFLDKSLIQFCFMDIIQKELDELVFEWNTHKIQKSRNSISQTGRPIIMFEIPSIYGAENCLLEVPNILFELLEQECVFYDHPCDEDVFNMCNYLMLENSYRKTNDPYDTLQVYLQLRRNIYSLLS